MGFGTAAAGRHIQTAFFRSAPSENTGFAAPFYYKTRRRLRARVLFARPCTGLAAFHCLALFPLAFHRRRAYHARAHLSTTPHLSRRIMKTVVKGGVGDISGVAS